MKFAPSLLPALAKSTAFVKNLLQKTNLTLQEIADIAEVSIDFVLKVKNTLPSA